MKKWSSRRFLIAIKFQINSFLSILSEFLNFSFQWTTTVMRHESVWAYVELYNAAPIFVCSLNTEWSRRKEKAELVCLFLTI